MDSIIGSLLLFCGIEIIFLLFAGIVTLTDKITKGRINQILTNLFKEDENR